MKYLLLILVAWLAVGCMPATSTASGPALVHPNFPYAVSYDDEAEKSVLGDEWRLTTYRKKDKVSQTDPTELERKEGFEAKYEFDFNDDDETDAKATLPIPDLLFVNKRTNAKIEVVTLLLDVENSRKELRVLLNDIVEGGSGTRSLFVGFGRGAAGVEKRYATRLLDSEEASLGSQKGLVATIEQVDLDKQELDPKTPGRRSRLFLMRAPFAYYVGETSLVSNASATSSTSATSSGTTVTTATKLHDYPVLLLVEYSNADEDFEPQYPEFLRLLGKLHLLSDERLLGYLATQVARCNQTHSSTTELSLDVSAQGATSVHSSTGFEPTCLSSTVSSYFFAATGEARIVRGTFDYSKPLPKPEWLAQNEYQEQRPAPAPSATPASDAPAPAPEPAPAAAPGEKKPEEAPAAPPATAQPGG